MKQIDYGLVARCVSRYFCRHKSNVSVKTFTQCFDKCINAQEASRLFAYFTDVEQILLPINKRYYKWDSRVHQDHFMVDTRPKVDYFKQIFEDYDIQSRFGHTAKKHALERKKNPRRKPIDMSNKLPEAHESQLVNSDPVEILKPVERPKIDVAGNLVPASIEEHIKALYALGVSEITLTFRKTQP